MKDIAIGIVLLLTIVAFFATWINTIVITHQLREINTTLRFMRAR